MIAGKKVWPDCMTEGMDIRKISGQEIFTFVHMRNNYYEVLEDSMVKYPDRTAFIDNWGRTYSYQTFVRMVDDFA